MPQSLTTIKSFSSCFSFDNEYIAFTTSDVYSFGIIKPSTSEIIKHFALSLDGTNIVADPNMDSDTQISYDGDYFYGHFIPKLISNTLYIFKANVFSSETNLDLHWVIKTTNLEHVQDSVALTLVARDYLMVHSTIDDTTNNNLHWMLIDLSDGQEVWQHAF